MITITFFSAINLIFLGILGEYISRLFFEVKARPTYIIAEYLPNKNYKVKKK